MDITSMSPVTLNQRDEYPAYWQKVTEEPLYL